jgi:hypothetical protein
LVDISSGGNTFPGDIAKKILQEKAVETTSRNIVKEKKQAADAMDVRFAQDTQDFFLLSADSFIRA